MHCGIYFPRGKNPELFWREFMKNLNWEKKHMGHSPTTFTIVMVNTANMSC